LVATLCLAVILLQPISAVFPYTTLFRSILECWKAASTGPWITTTGPPRMPCTTTVFQPLHTFMGTLRPTWPRSRIPVWNSCCTRSEEHTSELQSRENLVCRLLLENKKDI